MREAKRRYRGIEMEELGVQLTEQSGIDGQYFEVMRGAPSIGLRRALASEA
jgi:hypothetical protein